MKKLLRYLFEFNYHKVWVTIYISIVLAWYPAFYMAGENLDGHPFWVGLFMISTMFGLLVINAIAPFVLLCMFLDIVIEWTFDKLKGYAYDKKETE